MNSTDEISEMKQKIEKMEIYIKELEEHLKKYTNNNNYLMLFYVIVVDAIVFCNMLCCIFCFTL